MSPLDPTFVFRFFVAISYLERTPSIAPRSNSNGGNTAASPEPSRCTSCAAGPDCRSPNTRPTRRALAAAALGPSDASKCTALMTTPVFTFFGMGPREGCRAAAAVVSMRTELVERGGVVVRKRLMWSCACVFRAERCRAVRCARLLFAGMLAMKQSTELRHLYFDVFKPRPPRPGGLSSDPGRYHTRGENKGSISARRRWILPQRI